MGYANSIGYGLNNSGSIVMGNSYNINIPSEYSTAFRNTPVNLYFNSGANSNSNNANGFKQPAFSPFSGSSSNQNLIVSLLMQLMQLLGGNNAQPAPSYPNSSEQPKQSQLLIPSIKSNSEENVVIDEPLKSTKEEPIRGYTAIHQSLAWGEPAAQKMWSLYDANKDGILDHDEDAALRATFTQGSAGMWTDYSCKQMMDQDKTPELFRENLRNIKLLENKESNMYYKATLNDYEAWKGKPGTV